MTNPRKKAVIVGGGLAGLACAWRLQEMDWEPLVVESSETIGGRVRTDEQDGFLLDHGFQVFLSAYPVASEVVDLEALALQRFRPGALVHRQGRTHRMMDVFRCPQHLLGTAWQPIGTLRDKWLVGKLRRKALRMSEEEIAETKDQTTERYLREFGFSEGMIASFFRPFYGGIFLERALETSCRLFLFTFKMFAKGYATLPADGMRAIPRQLAARLPSEAIRCEATVTSVSPNKVTLASGESLEADVVVLATDVDTARRLVPGSGGSAVQWRSVVGLYFSADQSPLKEAIIALNADADALVNNVCVLSDLSPNVAPPGKALVSVSVLGRHEEEGLEARVQKELARWFGPEARQWRPLRTYHIPKALPAQPPNRTRALRTHAGHYFCGDYCETASIEGAIRSGLQCAEAIASKDP